MVLGAGPQAAFAASRCGPLASLSMCTNGSKVIAIVQLVLVSLALILSIIAL